MTLKIIWNLRSIHEGKGEKEAFYRILALAPVDELSNISRPAVFLHNKGKPKPKRRQRHAHPRPPRLEIDLKPVIKAMRSAVGAANHARLHQKLADPKYRALYVAVARLFSARLLADSSLWKSGDQAVLRDISLAPKWAPSPLGTHDRHSNISTAIARLVYHDGSALALPSATFPSALKDLSLDTPEATDILRSYYRRWVLTPLRAGTRVTETLMSANRWKDISYSGVSSVCMKNNKGHFFRHDPEGFQKYLISVEKGKRSITGATLKPHVRHTVISDSRVCRICRGLIHIN
ncbi:hypothetical protein FB45DRAFT_778651 [Roridomyces roridus]|uniref:DUF2828 domain-containing protein n=1 Tax=Roridomyces roridus TaxID=1738132 RepID=A0AAD7CIE0_9AGAR|nr:hypothetical protein FB45DRAFT_778651 [Roridomyces roridus]